MKRIPACFCLSLNVGDCLTPYLIEKLTGEKAMWVSTEWRMPHFILAGSMLNHANECSTVWGAGLASMTDKVHAEPKILAVRGPLSRMLALHYGANCPDVMGDPGLILPKLYTPYKADKKPLGIVPHYVDMARAVEWWASDPGVHVIDPFLPVEDFCQQVAGCERILSSSLHGLIIADAYGVPNAWGKFSDSLGGDGCKFYDHFLFVGKAKWGDPPKPAVDWRIEQPPKGVVDWLIKNVEFRAGEFDPEPLWNSRPWR